MQIVIDIPEDVKNRLCFGITYPKDIQTVCKALNNGTPLPKGYGRLLIIDENKMKDNQMELNFSCQKWISEVGLSNSTVAIIEADKTESEEV